MTISAFLFEGWTRPSGPSCRRCSQPISRTDAFGLSERICATCRGQVRSSRRRSR